MEGSSLVGALVDEVRERLARRTEGSTVLVGVDGRSGSGKTRLTQRLAAELSPEPQVAVVHLDDLYPGWDGLAEALPVLCRDVVAPLRTRPARAASFRSWDWHRSAPGLRITVPSTPVVLVEGVGVLASPCAHDLDLRVWLEAPVDVRRARALERDREVFAPHWERWAAQEDDLFGPWPARPEADLVVAIGTDGARDGAAP